jgi:hypothetical protein
MLPIYIESRQRAKVFSGMKYPNKDGIRIEPMSDNETTEEYIRRLNADGAIPGVPVPMPEVPADEERMSINLSQEIHGIAATGYLNDNSPLQFNNRQGHNWSLMVMPRDIDSPIKRFLWVLAINKTCGARNFLLQLLQDLPDIAFVMLDDEKFLRILEELDVYCTVFNEDHLAENVSDGIAVIEADLYRRRAVSVDSINAMLQN